MGMDVYSKNGNYFRSSVWHWRPLVSLMYHADMILFGKVGDGGDGWHYNQGDGLNNPEDCQAMAEALSTERMARMFDTLKETNGMLAGEEVCPLSGLT